jgi:hypothetical protein
VGLIVFLILWWSLAYSVEKARDQWRHTRDGYARDIARANPGWHKAKVRRHARRRAVTWWAREAAEGFPAIRQAWAEDRDHVRYLRETERIGRETRLAELRAELNAIRRGREEHGAAVEAGDTTLPFGPWYQQNADRIRADRSDRAATQTPASSRPGEPAAVMERPPEPSANGAEAAPRPASVLPARPVVNDRDREELIRQLAAAAASPDAESWMFPEAAVSPDPRSWFPGTGDTGLTPADPNGAQSASPAAGPAPGAAARAAEEFHAAITEGRLDDAEAAHQRYRAAVDAKLATAGVPVGSTQDPDRNSRQATPSVWAQPGGRISEAPGQRAGEPNRDNYNGGNDVNTYTDVPNGELAGDSPYRAAFTALEGYDRAAQQHEQAAETLEAQLTVHGFDRDPELMEQIRGLRETAGQIRARTAQARQVLVDHHAAGDEYHRSGVDAEATAFRS